MLHATRKCSPVPLRGARHSLTPHLLGQRLDRFHAARTRRPKGLLVSAVIGFCHRDLFEAETIRAIARAVLPEDLDVTIALIVEGKAFAHARTSQVARSGLPIFLICVRLLTLWGLMRLGVVGASSWTGIGMTAFVALWSLSRWTTYS